MIAFISSRLYAISFPQSIISNGQIHIHHFWYGIILLLIGGWLGLAFRGKRSNLLGSIFYGFGSGLLADEIGLLLTWGNYYSALTYQIVVPTLAIIGILYLIKKYGIKGLLRFKRWYRKTKKERMVTLEVAGVLA